MADKNPKSAPAPEAVGASNCLCVQCKKKPERAGFCAEHYVWFKEGLITISGQKAKDFDKKYFHFVSRQKSA